MQQVQAGFVGDVFPSRVSLENENVPERAQIVTVLIGKAVVNLYRTTVAADAFIRSNGGTVMWAISGGELTFRTREAMVENAPYPKGTLLKVGDVTYTADTTLTGIHSALGDIGVSGYRAEGMPQNFYIMASHDTHPDTRYLRIYISHDAQTWRLLSTAKVESNNLTMAGGNPTITWFNGMWHMSAEWSATGIRDFHIFRSRDLITWQRFDCFLGDKPLHSQTVPAPGASVPATHIWGMDSFVDSRTGVLWVAASVRYEADVTDDFGFNVMSFRTYYAPCVDPDNLKFGPVKLLIPNGHNWNMIDPNFFRLGGDIWYSVKDELAKNIRIYRGTSMDGPWTLSEVVNDPAYKIEGSFFLPEFVQGVTPSTRIHMLAEAHNDRANNRSVMMFRYTKPAPMGTGTFGPRQRVHYTRPARHGAGLNLGYVDRAAMANALKCLTAFVGDDVEIPDLQQQLNAGSIDLYPQQDTVYYVSGASVANVTLMDGPARRFYIGVLSNLDTAGVRIEAGAYFARAMRLGFGQGKDQLVEFRRRGDGVWIPVGTRGTP